VTDHNLPWIGDVQPFTAQAAFTLTRRPLRATVGWMVEHDAAWVAEAAGIEQAYVIRLSELGILGPPAPSGYGAGDARRAALVRTLDLGGLPPEHIATAVREGRLSLGFVDHPSYRRFASHQPVTFRETSVATGIPVDLVLVIREAMGFAQPHPDDRM